MAMPRAHWSRRFLAVLGAVAAVATVTVAAGPAPGAAARPGSGPAAGDWLTYGYDLARTGDNPTETVLQPGVVPRLKQRWSVDLGGVINTSPTVVSGLQVAGQTRTLVYAGSQTGMFFAIDASSGRVVWQRALGRELTQCGDLPGGVFGITDTPVIDRTASRIYVVGGTGKLYALDLATGAVEPGWPVTLISDPAQEHVWAGLTLAGGQLYAGVASYCDFRPYHGRLVAVNVADAQIAATFYPAGPHFDGGAIWAWGGASVDAGTGVVYVATGNAFAPTQYFLYAEHVVALTSGLRVLAANHPPLVGSDVDFGSTPTLYQAPGCPAQLAVENKSGVLFVYDRDAIDGGPVQRLQVADVNDDEFDGMPAYSTALNMVFVSNSSDSSAGTYRHGMVAFTVGQDCRLHLAWQSTVGPAKSVVSTPTVAAGVVYYGDGTGNTVFAFDARTGQQLWTSGRTLGGPVFTAPVVTGGQLYVSSWDHHLHAYAAGH